MEKKEKVEKIKRSKAYKDIRKSLIDQLFRNGNDTPHFRDMVEDYMKMYIVKELAGQDVMERGTTVEYNNGGGQRGWKKNESVDQILKTNQQMIRLLDSLGIRTEDGECQDDEEM